MAKTDHPEAEDAGEETAACPSETETQLSGEDIANWRKIDRERRRLWIEIIKRANVAQHISAYSNDVMKMTIIVFDDICDEIPTEFLWKSFKYSFRHRRSRLWGATDMWQGWEAFQESAEYRRITGSPLSAQAERTRLQETCERCERSGWEIDPVRGARVCRHAPLTDEERAERGMPPAPAIKRA